MFLYILLALLVYVAFYNFYWKRRKFPPGPIPLPLVGNAFNLKNGHFEAAAEELHAKYGKYYTLWFDNGPMVVVNDYELMKKIFVDRGDHAVGRPANDGILEDRSKANLHYTLYILCA